MHVKSYCQEYKAMTGYETPFFGPSYKTRAAFLPQMDPKDLRCQM